LSEPVEHIHPNGLIECSRRGEVVLPSESSIGRHVEELRLEYEGRPKVVHPILWETSPAIRSVPEGLLFSGSDQGKSKSLIIRSIDEREFRIDDVEDEQDQISTTFSRHVAKNVHRLDVTLKTDRKTNGLRKLVIRTDHPDQRVVEVPYIILENAP
jgi:hypothetical protein